MHSIIAAFQRIALKQNYATYGYGCWAVVERQRAELVGFCGLVHPGGSPRVELIYALRPDYWGRGLATEIVRGALDVGFHVYGLARIVATVDPQNEASLRVLRKLGLAQVGEELDEDGLPTLVYAVECRRDT